MPPKRRRSSARSHICHKFDDSDNYDEIIDIPNPDDSGDSDAGFDEHFDDGNNDHYEIILYKYLI